MVKDDFWGWCTGIGKNRGLLHAFPTPDRKPRYEKRIKPYPAGFSAKASYPLYWSYAHAARCVVRPVMSILFWRNKIGGVA